MNPYNLSPKKQAEMEILTERIKESHRKMLVGGRQMIDDAGGDGRQFTDDEVGDLVGQIAEKLLDEQLAKTRN